MIREMVAALQNEGSKNGKIAILKTADLVFQDVLYRAYNPEFNYYIKSVRRPAQYGQQTLHELWPQACSLLINLHNRSVTGNSAHEAVATLMSLMKQEEAAIFESVLKRDIRCGVNVSTINTAIPGLIPEYPYMRCSLPDKSNIGKFNWKAGVISQEKADGMFVNIIRREGGEILFQSRNGSIFPMVEFGTLVSVLEQLNGFHDETVLHGEMVVTDISGNVMPREEGNGMLNSVLKGGEFPYGYYPKVYLWDMLPLADYKNGLCEKPYSGRLYALQTMVKNVLAGSVAMIETRVVHSMDEARAHYTEITEAGKEGTILKDPVSIWKDGTSKDCVKFKIEAEVDLLVTGVNAGNGKNADTFGSLVCQSSDGLVEVAVSGFADADRERIAGELDQWIGKKIITVRANNLMPVPQNGGKRSLFLPRFVEERLDKTEADSLDKIEGIFRNAK